MAYCTFDDMNDAIPYEVLEKLADDTDVSLNRDYIEWAVDSAADEMDVNIGSKYALPLSETPNILKKLNVDIAVYNLYSRVKETVPELRKIRYQAAIRILEKIASGEVTIGVPEPSESGSAESRSSVRSRVFDSDTLARM